MQDKEELTPSAQYESPAASKFLSHVHSLSQWGGGCSLIPCVGASLDPISARSTKANGPREQDPPGLEDVAGGAELAGGLLFPELVARVRLFQDPAAVDAGTSSCRGDAQ